MTAPDEIARIREIAARRVAELGHQPTDSAVVDWLAGAVAELAKGYSAGYTRLTPRPERYARPPKPPPGDYLS